MKHQFKFSERWAVYQAHERICIYCRNVVEWRDFEVDHIINESLLNEPERLASLAKDYGLLNTFSINSFENWACSHHNCNRVKSDTTFDKSRALHYLLLAQKKAEPAQRIYHALEKANGVNKVLAHLRALLENGTITRQEIVDFASAVVRNASVSFNNPVVLGFSLGMEEVYRDLPEDAPSSAPSVFDWLENQLTNELEKQLNCRLEVLESERNGETISVRYAAWDLDFTRLDDLQVQWWELLEIRLVNEIYDEFVQRDN